MRAREYFPPVEVDRRPLHPDIVFFQHRETLATLAVDVDSGRFLGYHGGWDGLPLDEVPELERAASRYAQRRSHARVLRCLRK